MSLRNILKKIVIGKRFSSDTYIAYLRNIGIKIGDDCTIFVPSKTLIDEQYPWMISIGDHVRISEGVKILTHDFAWSVPKTCTGGVYGTSGKVEIGNNVFIGMNTIICRNVSIGDNVILGAGSVVTKNCESNSVYAGNPAKRIRSLNDFIDKRKAVQKEEAMLLVKEYKKRYGCLPEEKDIPEYFMLFTDCDHIEQHRNGLEICKNPQMSRQYMKENPSEYKSFEDFLKDCFK